MVKALAVGFSLTSETFDRGHEIDLALEEFLIRELICAGVLT